MLLDADGSFHDVQLPPLTEIELSFDLHDPQGQLPDSSVANFRLGGRLTLPRRLVLIQGHAHVRVVLPLQQPWEFELHVVGWAPISLTNLPTQPARQEFGLTLQPVPEVVVQVQDELGHELFGVSAQAFTPGGEQELTQPQGDVGIQFKRREAASRSTFVDWSKASQRLWEVKVQLPSPGTNEVWITAHGHYPALLLLDQHSPDRSVILQPWSVEMLLSP